MHGSLARGARARLVAIAIAASLTGCGDPPLIDGDSGIRLPDAGPPRDARPGFEDGGRIGRDGLEITPVVPDHGPFTGGNDAVIRGNGFTNEARVSFGDVVVEGVEFIDDHRLQVRVPAGRPGPVDVTVSIGDNTVTLDDGYTYESIAVTPGRGSTTGGTLIAIVGTGTNFQEGDTVTVGFGACTEVQVVSTTRIECRTPAGDTGTVDVVVEGEGGRVVAEDAFAYFEAGDPNYGGFGGGPIEGMINVLVVDAGTGGPLPGAFVMLGDRTDTRHRGFTDETGRISFSGTDVVAPATVHVGKPCYFSTSFVAFDAREVTAFTQNICEAGNGGRSVERNLAVVQGQLVWQGDFGTGVQPWFNLPEPREGWVRVAYVYTTQASVSAANPDPALVGPQRVLEENPGARGYPYAIAARPGGFAVYALAGLEHPASGRFVPYLLGVRRNILVGPGDRLEDIDIDMNIPLDHYLETNSPVVAAERRPGTDHFLLQANIDLGGEGVIVPLTEGRALDSFRAFLLGDRIRVYSQPSLEGALADGRYRIEYGWYGRSGVDLYNPQPTGDPYEHVPFTKAIVRNMNRVDARIDLPELLSVPTPLAPVANGRVPDDRVLRWRSDGRDPSFFSLTLLAVREIDVPMVGPQLFRVPVWQHFVAGNVREASLPNFAAAGPGAQDQLWSEPGYGLIWQLEAGVIPGDYDFDNFTYLDQNPAQWSHQALNAIEFTP